jgi:HEAT repeat protein
LPLKVVNSGLTVLRRIISSELDTAVACLKGEDELHRTYAVRAMANMDEATRRKLRAALVAALDDPSTMVRRQAAEALAELGDE